MLLGVATTGPVVVRLGNLIVRDLSVCGRNPKWKREALDPLVSIQVDRFETKGETILIHTFIILKGHLNKTSRHLITDLVGS